MPSVTSRGYPYPLGDDPIAVPADMQALAEAINTDVATIAANDPSVSTAGIIGEVRMYAGSTPPLTWLLCQGQAVSRTTYPELFAVIATRFGPGDNSTTFNLPNFQATLPVGVNANTNVPSGVAGFTALGGRGGQKDSSLPWHGHTGVDHLHGDDHFHTGTTQAMDRTSTHNHPIGGLASAGVAGGYATSIMNPFGGVTNNTHDVDINHLHNFQTNYKSQTGHGATTGAADRNLNVGGAGVDATNTNYPPSLALHFMIKAQ